MKRSFFARRSKKIAKNDKDKDDISSISSSTNKENQENFGILIVKLVKSKHDKGLGLTVSGGVDRGSQYPVISHLRRGGIADRSESLVIGDSILAVNKKKTDNLTHEEVVELLRNAGQHVNLKIQYKIHKPAATGGSTSSKTAVIQLTKESDGFGIIVRESPETSCYGYRPLLVASVRLGCVAHGRGVIQVGDRLLAINNQGLVGLSRDDVILLLKHAHSQVSLQIEYDVFHKEPLSTNRSTWIVEIEKPLPTVSLGLILVEDRSGVIIISDINEGGVADRCGVFHNDDQIVGINGTFIKDYSLSQVVEVLAKSGSRLKIEFLSAHRLKGEEEEDLTENSRHAKVDSWVCTQQGLGDEQLSERIDDVTARKAPVLVNDAGKRRELPLTPCSSQTTSYDNNQYLGDMCPYEEISDMISQNREEQASLQNGSTTSNGKPQDKNIEGLYSKVVKPLYRSNSLDPSSTGRASPWAGARALGCTRRSSFNNGTPAHRQQGALGARNHRFRRSGSLQFVTNTRLCRVEYVEVNLTADSQGFGLSIAEGFVDGHSVLVIADIEQGGPAERSGVLQVNDEVLGINDTDVGMMTADQCNSMLRSFGTHANILVGFTVAESIVASSGTFSVKLRKHYFGLGITFSDIARDNDEKSCVIISHVRKGSMAYRTGMLHLGDRLVALNGRNITHVEDAVSLIDAMPIGEIVSVTIHKEEELEDENSGVVYTVELSKKGQSSFGIVVAAADKPGGYNIVASLVPGTVAERSGAVHIGDRILAINDVLVKTKTVKDIYEMLDYSGEIVKLRLHSSNNQQNAAGSMELPDMTSLHRVSAWAEIFNELDQIVASSKSITGFAPKQKDELARQAGTSDVAAPGFAVNGTGESNITACVSDQVKSEREDFWENFDAFWDEHMSLAKKEKVGIKNAGKCEEELESNSTNSANSTTLTVHSGGDARNAGYDSKSGTLKGKCISVRYVVREKSGNPASREVMSREDSLERSPSMASGYETADSSSMLPGGSQNGSISRGDAFPSMDSFDISNDADDKLDVVSGEKRLLLPKTTGSFETRTFSVCKSAEHGFGFTLMPDKFKQEVYIASVLPGGPCDGILQPLDKITKIDHQDLTQLNIYEIIQILHHRPTTIQVTIVRNITTQENSG